MQPQRRVIGQDVSVREEALVLSSLESFAHAVKCDQALMLLNSSLFSLFIFEKTSC